jgi:hypothetical protein
MQSQTNSATLGLYSSTLLSAESPTNLSRMLEIPHVDASSSILQSQGNISPGLIISRKRKLDDLETSYTDINASIEKKKLVTQLGQEATKIKGNSNQLSCDEINEIPQEFLNFIKSHFQRNGSKSEIDEKYD